MLGSPTVTEWTPPPPVGQALSRCDCTQGFASNIQQHCIPAGASPLMCVLASNFHATITVLPSYYVIVGSTKFHRSLLDAAQLLAACPVLLVF